MSLDYKVIMRCDKTSPTTQRCSYFVEIDGVERSLDDILNENRRLKRRLEKYEPDYSDDFLETVANINKISVEELKEMMNDERNK